MWMGRGTLTLRGKNFIVPEKERNWLLLQIRASQTAFCEAWLTGQSHRVKSKAVCMLSAKKTLQNNSKY